MEKFKLTLLGTGNAAVTKCYNTCFAISKKEDCFLIDAGGGNTILAQLEKVGISLKNIHTIFVTHKHIDHILGVIWMIRMICQNIKKGAYEGELTIYAHEEVIGLLRQMCTDLLQKSQSELIGKSVHLVTVQDGEERTVLGQKVQFFDIHSTKAKQFGFTVWEANGCCMRHFVCSMKRIFLNLMRNIIPLQRMQQYWQRSYRFGIWCFIIPKIKIYWNANKDIPKKRKNIFPDRFLCRRI